MLAHTKCAQWWDIRAHESGVLEPMEPMGTDGTANFHTRARFSLSLFFVCVYRRRSRRVQIPFGMDAWNAGPTKRRSVHERYAAVLTTGDNKYVYLRDGMCDSVVCDCRRIMHAARYVAI
jgi:hypothetical protein